MRPFQVVWPKILQNDEARAKEPALAGKKHGRLPPSERKQHVKVSKLSKLFLQLKLETRYRLGNVQVATSIVASGGYEDDMDSGDVLI